MRQNRHLQSGQRPRRPRSERPPASRARWLRSAHAARTVALAVTLAATGLALGVWRGGEAGGSFAAVRLHAPLGPERVPIPRAPALANPGGPVAGARVDGIPCGTIEQLAFHVHAHLALVVAGAPRQVPAGIGIGSPRSVEPTPRGAFVA